LQTMLYDPNGTRQFTPTAQYAAANDLSQYTTRTIAGNQTTAAHDLKGNTTTGLDGSVYTYDAQNRLLTAQKSGGQTMSFAYDGLNRQVSRRLGNGGTTYYSVWDGWDLVEDYHKSGNNAVVDATYVYGATGLVRDMENANHYYYQDGSGSISHLANNSGTLLEWYRYDMDGNPVFYYANDTQRSPNQSGYAVRHLFSGQQWHQDIGLYDLRNRFYSPDIGRFLQSDPIGFRGGTNLYRYCGNNPVTRRDPSGLGQPYPTAEELGGDPGGDWYTPQNVTAPGLPDPSNISRTGFLPGSFGGWPGIPFAPGVELVRGKEGLELHIPDPEPESPSVQHPQPSSVPPQNAPQPSTDPLHATTTAEFIAIGNAIEHGNTMDTEPAIDPISLASGAFAARAVLTMTARAAAGEGTQVFRVFGSEAKGLGQYYTTVNPGTVANYRQAAGLFSGNSGQFVLQGTLRDTEGVIFTKAAPGPGGIGGGLPEVFVPNPETQISILRVSGANPEF